MKNPPEKVRSERLVEEIINGMREKKGCDIISLDLRKIDNSVCDFFVICTGTSNTHVNALAGSIEEEVQKSIQDKPWHVEGTGQADWVLMDYVNVVVHIFQRAARDFYDLEGLWADAEVMEYEDEAA